MIKTSKFYFWFWCEQMYNLQKNELKTLGLTPGSRGTLSDLNRHPHPGLLPTLAAGPLPRAWPSWC